MAAKRILIRKADLASKAGVTRSTVQRLCDGRLKPALVKGKVDAGHPLVVAYLQERSVDPTVAPPPKPKRQKVEGHTDDGTPAAAASLAHLTLDEIGRRFGGNEEFSSWLKSLNLVETIRTRRLENEEIEGSLIRRDLVETHLLGLIEEQHQRLLHEVSKTLTRTLYGNAAAGIPIEQSEREVRQTLGKTLDSTKTKVNRRLRRT